MKTVAIMQPYFLPYIVEEEPIHRETAAQNVEWK